MNGSDFGRLLILIGVGIVFLGIVVLVLSKFISLGHLPGDIYVKKGNSSFYFPIVSCIVISVVLSVILNLFRR